MTSVISLAGPALLAAIVAAAALSGPSADESAREAARPIACGNDGCPVCEWEGRHGVQP